MLDALEFDTWTSSTGQHRLKWGIINGYAGDGPALVITNDSDEVKTIIPVAALQKMNFYFGDNQE